MNASGAPTASVAAEALSTGGKNSKLRKGGTPSGLERGLNKGSARFQEILAARASQNKQGAALVSAAARAAAKLREQVAAGLKGLLAELLTRAVAADRTAGAASRVSAAHADELKTLLAGKDRKPARGRAVPAGLESAALVHPGTSAHTAAVKELKDASPEPAKAAAVETARSTARPAPQIHVVDLRRHQNEPASSSTVRKLDPAPSQDRDLSLSTVTRPASRETPFESIPRPAVTASPAQTPLERLREMAGSELVRASQLVLKDGGGEIRLVLKPESLGSIRVRMNLVDNSIEGRIIVDSSAVKHVLDGSVDALRRALTAEGFQMGSLQVSVGGQDAQSDPRRDRDEAPAEVRRIAAQGFERSVPGAQDVSLGDLFVNLFV